MADDSFKVNNCQELVPENVSPLYAPKALFVLLHMDVPMTESLVQMICNRTRRLVPIHSSVSLLGVKLISKALVFLTVERCVKNADFLQSTAGYLADCQSVNDSYRKHGVP